MGLQLDLAGGLAIFSFRQACGIRVEAVIRELSADSDLGYRRRDGDTGCGRCCFRRMVMAELLLLLLLLLLVMILI